VRLRRAHAASRRQPWDAGELMVRLARSIARSFGEDIRAGAATEFGLLAMPVVLGLLNAVDLGRYEYRRIQVENAAQVAAQEAWQTCNTGSLLPATQNCSALQSALTTAIQSTPLGANVALSSGYPSEGYYCATSSNTLQSVGSLSSKPANCAAAGNSSASPGDYLTVSVTYAFSSLFPGVTIVSAWGITSITATSWMRLG
jgi:Flp pilus assembly protein TadG